MDRIKIDTEYIKLDQLLKWAGIIGSGSDAKMLIYDGLVEVNGIVVEQRGKKVFPGDRIIIHMEKDIEFIVE
ncbi:RNA-binding S4 domain-containing protein [Petroclostridium sp. X23]|jgi:ribosome-associated protein|uniref:RNA-binding S4 domain-containing protein n=1 Tax=Petroclostridium sp. X23 TaxID=3045146 RepID=UPI0024AD2BC9|nr:RNA-binding S4 domain-containing protein [Petroclostridium sp. X23]WHH57246.1 RNA-binding S4 domain-containing protein [Petroclostridium sp. X23]